MPVDFLSLFLKNGSPFQEEPPMWKRILFLTLLLILCISCARVEKSWQTATLLFFDTVCEIHLFCSPLDFESSQEEMNKIFQDMEMHFSPGAKSYSSSPVLTLYQKTLAIYRASDGCFDITVAPLSLIWGFRDHSHRIPSPEEIDRALEKVGMDKITIKSGEILLSPGVELDWGGIAKGFAIDLASQAMIHAGIADGFINAGGDLYCWGKNPDQESWRIGIKHPRGGGVSVILFITDLGAATTGDYQRFFIQEGIRYHHVFDPKSGYPSKGKQSVTVIGPETSVCDALSTALFVSGQPEKILQKFPDYGAILIDSEGRISQIGKAYPNSLRN
jgi:thiamine biosynthesis lipoprotein